MEFAEFLKIYGPLAIGWVVAAYLMKFILDRYAQDIDARVKLASALDNLAKAVSEHGEKQNA
jgi:hypothetical protein